MSFIRFLFTGFLGNPTSNTIVRDKWVKTQCDKMRPDELWESGFVLHKSEENYRDGIFYGIREYDAMVKELDILNGEMGSK